MEFLLKTHICHLCRNSRKKHDFDKNDFFVCRRKPL